MRSSDLRAQVKKPSKNEWQLAPMMMPKVASQEPWGGRQRRWSRIGPRMLGRYHCWLPVTFAMGQSRRLQGKGSEPTTASTHLITTIKIHAEPKVPSSEHIRLEPQPARQQGRSREAATAKVAEPWGRSWSRPHAEAQHGLVVRSQGSELRAAVSKNFQVHDLGREVEAVSAKEPLGGLRPPSGSTDYDAKVPSLGSNGEGTGMENPSLYARARG